MEDYYLNVIRGVKRGFLASCFKALLYPLSKIYFVVMKIRNALYDSRWFRCYTPPVKTVISIGNIVMGGSGKTPAVQMLADEFYSDIEMGILTRGYRSLAENAEKPVVLHNSKDLSVNGVDVGDEALLHAERFPNARVIVNKDRVQGSTLASVKGVKLLILDDGMQHRKLDRDFDIAVVNGRDPFGKGHLFPRGFLRESPQALKRADLILINHIEEEDVYLQISKKIKKYSNAPCVGTHLKVTGIYDLAGNRVKSIEGVKVGLFCAIGTPESFLNTVLGEKGLVIDTLTAPDHQHFPSSVLRQYATSCLRKGAECLLCTEKDKVKISKDTPFPLPIYWVEVKMEVIRDHHHWKSFTDQVRETLFH